MCISWKNLNAMLFFNLNGMLFWHVDGLKFGCLERVCYLDGRLNIWVLDVWL